MVLKYGKDYYFYSCLRFTDKGYSLFSIKTRPVGRIIFNGQKSDQRDSAPAVAVSSLPVTGRPWACWNSRSALAVFGPAAPSGVPTL